MRIRMHARATANGIMLCRISTEWNAESVRSFFLEMGIAADAPVEVEPADYHFLLLGTDLEVFDRLIRGANIELV